MDFEEMKKLQACLNDKIHDLDPERFSKDRGDLENEGEDEGEDEEGKEEDEDWDEGYNKMTSADAYDENIQIPLDLCTLPKLKMGTRTQIEKYEGSLKPIGAGCTFSDALEVQQNSKRWACFAEDFTHIGPNVDLGSETPLSKETWFTFTDYLGSLTLASPDQSVFGRSCSMSAYGYATGPQCGYGTRLILRLLFSRED
ncbi:hypothetical protein LZ30DRAFT_825725 [Colletotrichum cereale]|nr:hypothetical protein LZ30DRAFT_825725 [Colletotrichum cereale]